MENQSAQNLESSEPSRGNLAEALEHFKRQKSASGSQKTLLLQKRGESRSVETEEKVQAESQGQQSEQTPMLSETKELVTETQSSLSVRVRAGLRSMIGGDKNIPKTNEMIEEKVVEDKHFESETRTVEPPAPKKEPEPRQLTLRPAASLQKQVSNVSSNKFVISYAKDQVEPELHCIGQIVGLTWLDPQEHANAFCTYRWFFGDSWEMLCSKQEQQGQTQVDQPAGSGAFVVFNHPLDAHFFTDAVQGWPKLVFEVFTLDSYGNAKHRGYAMTFLPTQAGHHVIECGVWRPLGTEKEEVASFFLGVSPQLRTLDAVYQSAQDQRSKLITTGVATLQLEVDIILRNFDYHDIGWQGIGARQTIREGEQPETEGHEEL